MEVQLENEHLQTKLKALRAKQHSAPSSLYSTSSALFTQPQGQQADSKSPFYLGPDTVKSPIKLSFDISTIPNSGPGDEESEDGHKKKKVCLHKLPWPRMIIIISINLTSIFV